MGRRGSLMGPKRSRRPPRVRTGPLRVRTGPPRGRVGLSPPPVGQRGEGGRPAEGRRRTVQRPSIRTTPQRAITNRTRRGGRGRPGAVNGPSGGHLRPSGPSKGPFKGPHRLSSPPWAVSAPRQTTGPEAVEEASKGRRRTADGPSLDRAVSGPCRTVGPPVRRGAPLRGRTGPSTYRLRIPSGNWGV
ncbi:hypothetical protein M885DRAFT_341237 [Pelagophyceae sp. CCMP2097]|nr:hypothetical protein M885DRAFT_341237 [Pelagophyceae sp. CCMP2097]